MKHSTRWWMLVALGLIEPSVTHAGGFALSEQSAVAGGTGGASTARDDDPSAAWYNPAAAAMGDGLRLAFGGLLARPAVHAEALDGSWSTDADAQVSVPPHLHAVYSRGDLAAGVYLGVPFGGGVTWPADWPGRHEIVSTRLEVVRLAPFVAWRHGRYAIAGGLHLDSARLRVQRGLDFVDAEGDVHLDLRDLGVGAHLAGFMRVNPDLALGLTYKSRTRLRLSGNADFEAPPEFGMTTPDQRAHADMTLPDRLVVGASVKRGALRGYADLELSLWSVNQALVVDFDAEATPDPMQRNDWGTTLGLRAGAELPLEPAERVVVRAGALYDPSPSPATRLWPSAPDADRLGGTVGASWRVHPRVALDGFYERLWLVGRDAANPDSLAARYGGSAHILGLGARYLP